MGHLLCHSSVLRHVEQLAFEKAKNKYDVYTDGQGLGCSFYVLKSGLSPRFTYTISNNDTLTIDYSKLDKLNHEQCYHLVKASKQENTKSVFIALRF